MRKLFILLLLTLLLSSWALLVERKEAIDELGRRVFINNYPPERIISLAPSITELLFALGLRDKIVGVTNYCDKPKEALMIAKIGGFSDPNIELIVKLKPDIVIGTVDGNPIEIESALKKFSIPLFVLKQRSMKDILNNIISVSKVLGVNEKGKKLYSDLNEYIVKRKKIVSSMKERKRVLFLLWVNPLVSAGSESYINEIINLSKLVSVTDKEKGQWIHINEEGLTMMQYDVIVYAAHNLDDGGQIVEYINKNRRMFKKVPVYAVDEDILRPGISFPNVVKQLDEIAMKLSRK